MSTTLTRPATAPGRNTPGRNAPGLRLDPVGHRRRPALAVGSIALIVACVAVFISAYLKAGNQVSVLAVARTVTQGQVRRRPGSPPCQPRKRPVWWVIERPSSFNRTPFSQ
jgi:hypothetical protein